MSGKTGLYKKMYDVMNESEALEKDMTVGSGKNSYKAIGEATVLNSIKKLFKQHKLILIPVDVEVTEHFTEYKTSNTYNGVTTVNDKARFMTQLKTQWKIIDIETGEFELLSAPGNGTDTQDKASGKAFTYAYKAVIQKTFMLFSGEDTDNTHSDDITNQQQGKSNTITDNKKKTSTDKITTKQLSDMADSKGYDDDYIIKKYNKEFSKNIDDIKFITQEIKQKYYHKLSELPDGGEIIKDSIFDSKEDHSDVAFESQLMHEGY